MTKLKGYPLCCKGRAMALHLTKEYTEGRNASTMENPYDFFDQYEKHYAWAIGRQVCREKIDI